MAEKTAGPRNTLRLTLSVALALLIGCAEGSGSESLYLLDLAGQRVDPFSLAGVEAHVFLFTRTDCPISNRYAPEVQRLHGEYADRGVHFWLVYPDPEEEPDDIRQHLRDYGYTFEALRDVRHTLVERTGATVTPEAGR